MQTNANTNDLEYYKQSVYTLVVGVGGVGVVVGVGVGVGVAVKRPTAWTTQQSITNVHMALLYNTEYTVLFPLHDKFINTCN